MPPVIFIEPFLYLVATHLFILAEAGNGSVDSDYVYDPTSG
jgi:hypothetical protein